MRVCDAAIEVLKETGNEAVAYADSGLLDLIGTRAGLKGGKRFYADHVLAALRKQPGDLIRGTTYCPQINRWVSIFWLPEHAPERAKTQ